MKRNKVYLKLKLGIYKYIYLLDVTTKDIEYFNNCYNKDIEERHLMGTKDVWANYLKLYTSGETIIGADGREYLMMVIHMFGLFRNQIIGCSMVTNNPDGSAELLYIHIDEKYRRKGYSHLISKRMESCFPKGTKLIIRCLPDSIEGQNAARKLGYKLDQISDKGYYYYSKYTE